MFKLLTFLSLIMISVWHGTSGVSESASTSVPPCICDSDNVTIASYTYDDAAVRDVQLKLELIHVSNKALHVGMELLNERLKQQHEVLMEINRAVSKTSNLTADKVNHSNTISNKRFPSNCLEAAAFKRKSGLYTIQLDPSFNQPQPFLVACIEDSTPEVGGGWTVVQRRLDGSIDFYRSWAEYKVGFGNLEAEFWIGLDKLHALTTQTPQELLIIMEDFDNAKKYARYTAFAIGSEQEAYALNVLGSYSGDAGDSLSQHISMKFSTKDVDNDNYGQNCAVIYTGAWWHDKCHVSNLNGQYLRGAYSQDQFAKGVVWHTFRGYNYALKSVKMMIRPKRD